MTARQRTDIVIIFTALFVAGTLGYFEGKHAADRWYAKQQSIVFCGGTSGVAVATESFVDGVTLIPPIRPTKRISPTITSAGCGGVGAVISSVRYEPNDLIRFELVVGTAPNTRCVVNMPRRPRGYSCMVRADFSRWDFVQKEISVTPTSVTLQNFNYEGIPAAPESSSHWHVLCGPRRTAAPVASVEEPR